MQDFLNKYLSPQRLASYSYHGIDALDLYKWNIALSEALYPLLHAVEIALRNNLHNAISEHLSDHNWLISKNRKIFERMTKAWCAKIDSNIRELAIQHKLDENHLIAELSFGFWAALLGKQFEYKQFLWPTLKKRVFPFAHGIKIKEIRESFTRIRYLRNRVFHYEAIWHWENILERHDEIIRAIEWINPDLLMLIEQHRFKRIYTQKSEIIRKTRVIAKAIEAEIF